MSKYSEMCAEIERKIKSSARPDAKPACVTSASDLTAMTQCLLNSPDHVVNVYMKKSVGADGKPAPVPTTPSERYRSSLKPVLKAMGIDKAELSKLDSADEITFSKEHAAALMGLATTVIHDYVDAGRRFVFPITGLDEAQMSLSAVDVDEKITKPNRFVKDEQGRSVPQPTGKTVRTMKHRALKARNAVPYWLRDSYDTVD